MRGQSLESHCRIRATFRKRPPLIQRRSNWDSGYLPARQNLDQAERILQIRRNDLEAMDRSLDYPEARGGGMEAIVWLISGTAGGLAGARRDEAKEIGISG